MDGKTDFFQILLQKKKDTEYQFPFVFFFWEGFPRSQKQAESLDELLLQIKQPLDLVLFLKVDEQVIYSRIQERWYHEPSGRTYNLSYNPPKVPGKDDVTGEPLKRRNDDNLVIFLNSSLLFSFQNFSSKKKKTKGNNKSSNEGILCENTTFTNFLSKE